MKYDLPIDFRTGLDRFKPLTEEEQMDVLYLILESMNFYSKKMETAKSERERKHCYELFATYQMLSETLTVNPLLEKIGISHRRFLLNQAHNDRTDYENRGSVA